MCVEIRDPRLAHCQPIVCELPELSVDMKRMLKVQWKEFVHWLAEKGGDFGDESADFRLRQQLEPAIYASTIACRRLAIERG